MHTRDFDYELPKELIAQRPLPERSASRLLYLPAAVAECVDKTFSGVAALLRPGDLLVFNDTRVFPARLFGRKASGGRVEVLIERLVGGNAALVHVRASRSPVPGSTLALDGGVNATVDGREGELFRLVFDLDGPLLDYLERAGQTPLPPYIERLPGGEDQERYQTVYARRTGAVAAPTAGLHFDQVLLGKLDRRGVERAFVTLHVGAGTFQPVRAERVEDHVMHAEQAEVSAKVCRQIEQARERGGRVVAVGTTVVRSLEAASAEGSPKPFSGATNLFITPGFGFRAVDALVTNFHLPRSSLLMLVCAFGGYRRVMNAYRHAVRRRYRFFSYGDAMFIERGRD